MVGQCLIMAGIVVVVVVVMVVKRVMEVMVGLTCMVGILLK